MGLNMKIPGARITQIESEVNPLWFLGNFRYWYHKEIYNFTNSSQSGSQNSWLPLCSWSLKYMSGLKNPGSIWIVNGKTVSDGWRLSKIAYRMILSQIIKKLSRNWFFGWTILFQCSQNLCTAQLLLEIKLKCMCLKKVSSARCMSQFKEAETD